MYLRVLVLTFEQSCARDNESACNGSVVGSVCKAPPPQLNVGRLVHAHIQWCCRVNLNTGVINHLNM